MFARMTGGVGEERGLRAPGVRRLARRQTRVTGRAKKAADPTPALSASYVTSSPYYV